MVRILVVGASIGSLAAANRLRHLMSHADIIIINRASTFVHRRHIPHLLSGLHTLADATIDLGRYCEKHGLRFHLGTVGAIDAKERALSVGEQRLAYDGLIVDLPSEPSSIRDAGAEDAMPLAGEASAHALRTHLLAELRHAARTAGEGHRTTVVVGAGHRGIETAAEIHALHNRAASHELLFPEELNILLLHAAGDEREYIPRRAHAHAMEMLRKRGIAASKPTHVAYEPGRVTVDGHVTESGAVVWTAAEHGNRLFMGSGIAVDEDGYVLVDHALRTSDERVFALGHCIRAIGSEKVPRHRRAADLVEEGRLAAYNIAATILGTRLHTLQQVSRAPRVVTMGTSALGWLGPFSFHHTMPYALHRKAEARALERLHEA